MKGFENLKDELRYQGYLREREKADLKVLFARGHNIIRPDQYYKADIV